MKGKKLIPWHPNNLVNWKDFYPNTILKINSNNYQEFTKYFDKSETFSDSFKGFKLIFLRGYYADFMPGNLKKPLRYFQKLGFEAQIAPLKSGADVDRNSLILENYLHKQNRPYILLCHSKGGLDILTALAKNKINKNFLKGIIFSQTPSGASTVMDQILSKNASTSFGDRVKNFCMRRFIYYTGHYPGGLNLTSNDFKKKNGVYDTLKAPCPIISVASWSIKASSWVDSYHRRLSEKLPGVAHDGQFYLKDQLWFKNTIELILGGIDHAQPAMGGLGFDHCRYWQTLLKMLEQRC